MKKKFSIILIVVLGFYWFGVCQLLSVFAAEEFTSKLESEYTVLESHHTKVKKTFSIKNNKSTVYLKKYAVIINSNNVSSVSVDDQNGPIKHQATTVEGKTTISFEFPNQVVGKDQVRTFSIDYIDEDTTSISGKVVEIHIPKLADPQSFNEYFVTINLPQKYGLPVRSNPEPTEVVSENNLQVIKYTGQGREEGISLLFGDQQHYKFNLLYHLNNPTGNQGTVQIALPPDTAFQKVDYFNIIPPPNEMKRDQDGNWIATYQIEADQQTKVTADGTITVFLKEQKDVPTIPPISAHHQGDKFWEVKDTVIQTVAEKYKTPKQIYDFVVSSLQYNYDRLDSYSNRVGAAKALQQPENAVCQEFTDVFVTVARANNIPSRQVIGYAMTNNPVIRPISLIKDILHAWPEYYDPARNLWIPIDPTWGNTTQGVDYFSQTDLNHLTFAIQGVSSQYPFPAGSYKLDDVESKDITIIITEKPEDIPLQTSVQVKTSLGSILGVNRQQQLAVTNLTGRAWYNLLVQFNDLNNFTVTPRYEVIDVLLPFQTITIPVHITSDQLFRQEESTLQVMIKDEITQHKITSSPKVLDFLNPRYYIITTIVVISIIGTLGFIILLLTKKSKKKK